MYWGPIDSPYVQVKKAIYKRIAKVRVAIILLISAWHMKPSHFRADTDSIYKGLGWGLPLIPGSVYAFGAQPLFAPFSAEAMPGFPPRYWLVGNALWLAFVVYSIAFFVYAFHILMCRIGTILGMREAPPTYEFFLVRTSGAFMWFAISFCLITAPAVAKEPGMLGYLASLLVSVPLALGALFLIAGYSWLRVGSTGRVGLKEMYQSERFVNFVWRVQCGFTLIAFTTSVLIAKYPTLVFPLSQH